MGVSTRSKVEEPKKMKKSTSASLLLAMMKHNKPAVAPKPQIPIKSKMGSKTKPHAKVAPKPARVEKPIVPPKPTRRKSQTFGQNAVAHGVGLADRSRKIRSPMKRRSSGRLPKPAKTPGWSSPTDESFRRPIGPGNRRTSIYHKRIRMSLLDTDVAFLSPSKTRRRSVYGALPNRSPPKLHPRCSMAPLTTTLPMSFLDLDPVVVIDPIYEDPIELPKPTQVKKRRPVCGVAALRRKSVLPEVKPKLTPVINYNSEPVDHVIETPQYGENTLEKEVEIVDMDSMHNSPLSREETGRGDCNFFTPAGKALLDTSLYETPAVKIKATPSSRLPQSVSTRRYKTPRRPGTKTAVPFPDFETFPTNDILDIVTIAENTAPASVVPNVHNDEKVDSSKCVIS